MTCMNRSCDVQDVTCCNGTGLLDYYGNARPSWHAFRFWGDIPIERVVGFLI